MTKGIRDVQVIQRDIRCMNSDRAAEVIRTRSRSKQAIRYRDGWNKSSV